MHSHASCFSLPAPAHTELPPPKRPCWLVPQDLGTGCTPPSEMSPLSPSLNSSSSIKSQSHLLDHQEKSVLALCKATFLLQAPWAPSLSWEGGTLSASGSLHCLTWYSDWAAPVAGSVKMPWRQLERAGMASCSRETPAGPLGDVVWAAAGADDEAWLPSRRGGGCAQESRCVDPDMEDGGAVRKGMGRQSWKSCEEPET